MGMEGLEPSTSDFASLHAFQLRHTPDSKRTKNKKPPPENFRRRLMLCDATLRAEAVHRHKQRKPEPKINPHCDEQSV
jgi:hypothetical protein